MKSVYVFIYLLDTCIDMIVYGSGSEYREWRERVELYSAHIERMVCMINSLENSFTVAESLSLSYAAMYCGIWCFCANLCWKALLKRVWARVWFLVYSIVFHIHKKKYTQTTCFIRTSVCIHLYGLAQWKKQLAIHFHKKNTTNFAPSYFIAFWESKVAQKGFRKSIETLID